MKETHASIVATRAKTVFLPPQDLSALLYCQPREVGGMIQAMNYVHRHGGDGAS